MSISKRVYYHLPGLFEFYELYSIFLPLFFKHREYFYDWCDISSIYGAPANCLWGGGSAVVLEFLLYYMTKPEYQLEIREAIYLDSMLDLF